MCGQACIDIREDISTMGKEIGIDFGTTTTEVSYIDKRGQARSIKLEAGKDIIPTIIYFKSKEEYIIGRKANSLSKAYPEASVKNFKLFLTDTTKKFRIRAENGDKFVIKPIQIVQLYLNRLIQMVQPILYNEFGEEGIIEKAVITVPAQFNPEEKIAIKNAIYSAAKQAGFSDIKIATEPTAAAIAFQEEHGVDGNVILVYDFGGGTFDVSVIKKIGKVYTEIETDGNKYLGGNLLTEKIAEILWYNCLDEVDREYPFDETEVNYYSEQEYGLNKQRFILNRHEIFAVAEEMKLEFLDEDVVSTQVRFYFDNESDPQLIDLEMTLEEFYDIIRDDIEKTIEITNRVLKKTIEKEGISKINQVVLAGGSSQIRLIQELLSQNNDFKYLVGSVKDSSTLIARGAAKLAFVELQVEECTKFEIGTKISKGKQLNIFDPIIRAGEKLPCSGTRRYHLSYDGQTEMKIEYYEKDVKNYPFARTIDDDGIYLVSELMISGIPNKIGLAIDVTFSIEADGTPTITAEIFDNLGKKVLAEQLVITREQNLY